jgi:hypothetical protein
MPGIIEQIQSNALNNAVPVSTLLRQVKLAAAKLGLNKVEEWVDKELKGYTGDDEVPAYRKVRGSPVARGAIGGFEPIFFEGEAAEKFSVVPIGQSIPGIEGQLSSGVTRLIFPYPPALQTALNEVNRRQIVECGVKFDASNLVAIVEAVRTLVLEWAIEMERAGIKGVDATTFSQTEKDRAQSGPISIHIASIGTFTGNLGVGNTAADVSSSAIQVDRVEQLLSQIKSHSSGLAREGLDEDDLLRRVAAIEAELKKPSPNHRILRALLTELKAIIVGTAQGLLSTGVLSLLNQILGTGVVVPM